MTLCVPLLCVPLLDVIATWTLNLALCHWGLAEPVLALWLLSLLRVGLLTVMLQACSLSQSELPAWLQPQELSWILLVSSLLTPAYVSLSAAAGLPSAEMLYGLHNWSALALNYASTGLVFLLRWHFFPPSSDGQPVGEAGSKATLSRLLACMKPNIGHFLLVALFLVLSSLGEMAIPYYTGRMTDWVMNEDDPSAFTNSIIAMSLITSASALTEFICDCVYNVTMTRIHTRIQSSVFRSVVKQKICFFDTEHTGDITSRITTDTNTMSESLTEKLSLLMWYLMRAFFLLIFMVKLSFKLTLFSIIGMFIISIVPKYTGKYYQKLAVDVQESLAKANDVAMETFSSMKTVRSFANEDGESRRYSDRLEDTYRLNKKEAAAYAGFMWTNSLSDLALKVTLLYIGGCLVSGGSVSSGTLVSMIFYQLQFTTAIEVLISVYPNVKKAVGASEKVFEYIDQPPDPATLGTLAPQSLRAHVEFRNVTFSYPKRPNTPVLKNVSFELKCGEITALVGPSGGGKTTCVNLLERFYQPQSGQILLDGRPIEEYEHKYYHSKVALVSQEPVLFARSVERNIAYGLDQQPLPSTLEEAATRADAHHFITTLQEQYKTDVGEKGKQLSGGQKQRVAIARALIRHPLVVILDDATSCLDGISENTVLQSVYNGNRQRAVLVIAHRLSTIERADHIVVLEAGTVVEEGTHQELRENGGCYQRLLQKHFQGFGKITEEEEPELLEN
ncbi:antigen peptide transporter 1 [Hemiscyllium ocellatum]|uniref:antigen peptide transporter 1 n=1 Tax=Hemiscyllium ocellatum TaxID=170820 RepID=UPI002966F22F|nr:antigen peptide transporter 1 [Hemiscyllium ocellatum]